MSQIQTHDFGLGSIQEPGGFRYAHVVRQQGEPVDIEELYQTICGDGRFQRTGEKTPYNIVQMIQNCYQEVIFLKDSCDQRLSTNEANILQIAEQCEIMNNRHDAKSLQNKEGTKAASEALQTKIVKNHNETITKISSLNTILNKTAQENTKATKDIAAQILKFKYLEEQIQKMQNDMHSSFAVAPNMEVFQLQIDQLQQQVTNLATGAPAS